MLHGSLLEMNFLINLQVLSFGICGKKLLIVLNQSLAYPDFVNSCYFPLSIVFLFGFLVWWFSVCLFVCGPSALFPVLRTFKIFPWS